MKIDKNFKIFVKKKIYIFKKIELKEVNRDYIESLSFARYLNKKKKYTIRLQKKYLQNIEKKKRSFILGFFNKKKLLGTMGCQLHKKIIVGKKKYYNSASFGVLVFSKFRNKKLGQLMVTSFSKILREFFHIKLIFINIHPNNSVSRKIFINSSFVFVKRGRQREYYFLKKKITNKNYKNIKIRSEVI